MSINNALSHLSIAVIGAGPAGLSAALSLQDAGHNVTVFESDTVPGGKVQTLSVAGQAVDIGAVTLNGSYKNVLALTSRFHVPTAPYPCKFVIARTNHTLTDYLDLWKQSLGAQGMIAGGLHLGAINLQHAGVLGGDLASAHPELLTQSASEFFAANGLKLPMSLMELLSVGSGFTHFDEVPAIYAVRGLSILSSAIISDSLTSMGAYQLPQLGWMSIPGGFQTLWNQVAAELNVKYNHPVLRIERTDAERDSITVHCEANKFSQFDRVIVATPPWATLKFLDANPEERAVLSRIQPLLYRTTVVHAKGLPENTAAFFEKNIRDKKSGGVLSLIHVGADIYTAYQFLDGIDDAQANRVLTDDLAQLGASELY